MPAPTLVWLWKLPVRIDDDHRAFGGNDDQAAAGEDRARIIGLPFFPFSFCQLR